VPLCVQLARASGGLAPAKPARAPSARWAPAAGNIAEEPGDAAAADAAADLHRASGWSDASAAPAPAVVEPSAEERAAKDAARAARRAEREKEKEAEREERRRGRSSERHAAAAAQQAQHDGGGGEEYVMSSGGWMVRARLLFPFRSVLRD
jgi:hypothetical protein